MIKNQQTDQKHLHKLENVRFRPVFILGLHRSGTTILYKVLNATGCFNAVTAYHIMKYDRLIENHLEGREEAEKNEITESFRKKGLEDRKLDSLKITADFEEEYGFLLGQYSNTMTITPRNVSFFIEMCRKIQFISGNDKPVLLKNPFDFTNFLYIKQALPDAKFVFMQRNPFRTISSNLNALRMLYEHKNPYTTALSNIYDYFYSNPVMLTFLKLIYCRVPEIGVFVITRFGAKSVKFFLKNIEKLPKEDYVIVTYENFCSYPQQTLENIMDKLSLKMADKIDASAFINQREAPIDIKVKKMRRYIYSSMKEYFEKFNFSSVIE